MLRSETQKQSELGMIAKPIIDRGDLIPNDILIPIVMQQLPPQQIPYVIDGFPRTVEQAQALAARTPNAIVLSLSVDREQLRQRIAGRLVCPQCAASYHTQQAPPVQPGICDDCGSSLVKRIDDQAHLLDHRLDNYDQLTSPLVAFYERLQMLISIDANQPITNVYAQITAIYDHIVGFSRC